MLPLTVFAAYAAAVWGPSWMLPGIRVGFFVAPIVLAAQMLTDRTFKALGWSRSARMTENRRPSRIPPENCPDDDVIAIRPYIFLSNAAALVFLGLATLIFLLAEVLVPSSAQSHREALPQLYGMLLGIAGLAYLLRYAFVVRIDASGIAIRGMPLSRTRKKISWSEIASCDLIVVRDTLGAETMRPMLKDAADNELLGSAMQSLAVARREEQQRVFRYIKCRFPKLVVDPWEL
jgi:hypothetical protein